MPVLTAATTEETGTAAAEEEGSPLAALGDLFALFRLWFATLFSLVVVYLSQTNPTDFPSGYLLFWGALAVISGLYAFGKTRERYFD